MYFTFLVLFLDLTELQDVNDMIICSIYPCILTNTLYRMKYFYVQNFLNDQQLDRF